MNRTTISGSLCGNPGDLSEVLFIATANSTAEIPRPLLDRMEIIEVTSYTANENSTSPGASDRKAAGKERPGCKEADYQRWGAAEIILSYTSEAGVRELERKIGEICRKAARQLLEQKKPAVHVTGRNLEQYLGKRKIARDKANDKDDIGIVRGLAWTSVGGVTMQVEVNMMPGRNQAYGTAGRCDEGIRAYGHELHPVRQR